ncbi:flagellar hook-length control protein FliK [Sodalis sp. dw_96]|uniref:flagellar hook-length control protein FliK n=1 Tax=Sodalis sp. dw_96 TaxID=2719794 RepID=UPI0021048978|nr:flagellar hook-length control protein FliK [Sodalis sp. dw_96]
MITLLNELTPTAGVAAATSVTAAAADGGDQGFSALLNSKLNDRQQQQPASVTDGKAAANDNGSSDASTDVQGMANSLPTQVDSATRQREEKAGHNSGSDSDVITPVSVGVDPVDEPTTKTAASGDTTGKDADPALDSSAAQNLMALLAQTNPASLPVAQTISAGQTLAADVSGIPSLADTAASAAIGAAATLFAADNSATDNATPDKNADSAIAAAATQNQTPDTADNGTSLAQTSADYHQTAAKTGDASKSTIPATLPATLKKSTTAMALESQDKNASPAATDAKGQPVGTDSDASQAVVTPVSLGATNSAQTFNGTNDTVITLKKTGDVSIGGGSSQAGTASVATPTLSAAGSAATTTPTPASALISAQLGSDEWQQAIGQQVVMYSRDGQQSAELRLHPDSLGTVQISMQVDTNNQMQIHLVSGHSQVRAALEDALPQLRDSLAQSGINLGQSSVGGDAMPNWGGNGQNPSGGGQSGETFSLNTVAVQADTTQVTPTPASVGRAAGIDTFA